MPTIRQKTTKQRTARNIAPVAYTIDAAGRPLGRVASEAAEALMGKKSAHYVKNAVLPVTVSIINAGKLALTEKKIREKTYIRYTGFPGGLREMTLAEMLTKKGSGEVVRKAVEGMIPRNKLRKERMMRLTIID
jgi:large subunit ribosomal protein L13